MAKKKTRPNWTVANQRKAARIDNARQELRDALEDAPRMLYTQGTLRCCRCGSADIKYVGLRPELSDIEAKSHQIYPLDGGELNEAWSIACGYDCETCDEVSYSTYECMGCGETLNGPF